MLFAFSAAPALASGAQVPASSEKSEGAPEGDQYFRLDPFVVPIMSREAVTRHLTIIVTLELGGVNQRDAVRGKLPLLRHALNASLYQLVGIQRSDGSLPAVVTVKSRMLDVAREVAGRDTVRDVLMESIYERRLK